MPRMLGRWLTGGCSTGGPGRRRRCVPPGGDCIGHESDPRRFKLAERRAVRAEADAWFRAPAVYDPASDPSDCAHGCNGDCTERGSERCTFLCHPTDEAVLATQWAERTGHTTPAGDPDPGVLAAYAEHVEWMRAEVSARNSRT